MAKIGVYPGSFDPVTFGHIDIIQRASKLVDKLIVGVLVNSEKKPLFSEKERVKMIQESVADLENVEVCEFKGLTVDFAKENGAVCIIRGLRAVTDFEYELQLAQLNRVQNPDIETIFLTTNLKYSYLSSTFSKEVAAYGGDVSSFVPENVKKELVNKLKERMK